MNFRIDKHIFSDSSIAWDVLFDLPTQDLCVGIGLNKIPVRIACINRQHAQALCKSLDRSLHVEICC